MVERHDIIAENAAERVRAASLRDRLNAELDTMEDNFQRIRDLAKQLPDGDVKVTETKVSTEVSLHDGNGRKRRGLKWWNR
jgi:predicted DNA-binding protein